MQIDDTIHVGPAAVFEQFRENQAAAADKLRQEQLQSSAQKPLALPIDTAEISEVAKRTLASHEQRAPELLKQLKAQSSSPAKLLTAPDETHEVKRSDKPGSIS